MAQHHRQRNRSLPSNHTHRNRSEANECSQNSTKRQTLQFSSDSDNDSEDQNKEDTIQQILRNYTDFSESDVESTTEEDNFGDGFSGETRALEDEDEVDWCMKSEQTIAQGTNIDEELEGIKLSDKQAKKFSKSQGRKAVYPDFVDDARSLLIQDPTKYKRCQLKIESSHRSTANVLDGKCEYTEIKIDGRSKAGRTYTDDEVVVEVLAKPPKNKAVPNAAYPSTSDRVESAAHGKVVGLLKRVRFSGVDHPLLFCTLDEMEGHLMKPLCKTVPKIHVLNNNVKKRFPKKVKNCIEIKRINKDGNIEHGSFCDVPPDKRQQYVFTVAILAWGESQVYPLGAVLNVHTVGSSYSAGLTMLCLLNRVPKYYSPATVEETRKLPQQLTHDGREDLTQHRLFTIDPPGSSDLDDAVSIERQGSYSVVGVHIADVAAVVKEGSAIDTEAKRRGMTFYPVDRKPRHMLPEPLSCNKCSLLPGQKRLAFSFFFKFDEEGNQVGIPRLQRSVIVSSAKLTYDQAQRVINGDPCTDIDDSIQNDIGLLHKVTSKLVEARKKDSALFVPFEDPRLPGLGTSNDHMEAHALIEELMVLTNSFVADQLAKNRDVQRALLVRCQKAPSVEKLIQWQEKEGHVSHLVTQLQGKQITQHQQLSLHTECSTVKGLPNNNTVSVQSSVWKKLCRHLEQGEKEQAKRLAFMDHLHPLQCLASQHWMDLMEVAQYRCYHGLNKPDHVHFQLGKEVYTHFTSPICRYTDLHMQRLLHAALDGESLVYKEAEIDELCQLVNSAAARNRALDKGCWILKLAESLQTQSLAFQAFVEDVSADHLTVLIPSLLKVHDRKQELPFSLLGVRHRPEVVTDTALKQDRVTVRWRGRIYDQQETCPSQLDSALKHASRSCNRSPAFITLCPEQHTVSLPQDKWAEILKMLLPGHDLRSAKVPQPLPKVKFEVDYLSCERGDGTVVPLQFERTYTKGHMLQLQMSSEHVSGMPKLVIDSVRIASNASVCLLHARKPVPVLCPWATTFTQDQEFTSYKEHINAWMPLIEMEAAAGASRNDECVIIDNVLVTMKQQRPMKKKTLFMGSFSVSAKFCFDRGIQLGGKCADSPSKNTKNDKSLTLDYLCLRFTTECSSSVLSKIKESDMSVAVDKHYTWIAHGMVKNIIHKNRKADDGGYFDVTFVLSNSSSKPPCQLMNENGTRATVEILPKPDADR